MQRDVMPKSLLETVTVEDLPAIRGLIASAVLDSVAQTEQEAFFLLNDIGTSLEWWLENPDDSLHLKYSHAGSIVGVVLVKHFWNLTNLFVAPGHQGRGIGRILVTEALNVCRTRSPRSAVLVNSSANAVGFYERLGFTQTGPGEDRTGGSVPFSYGFP